MTAPTALRPGADEHAPYYARYVALVPEGDVIQTLRSQIDETLTLLRGIPEAKSLTRYAPDKWTVRQVIGHMCDTERIFAYRALRFARNDTTELPGYDQDAFVASSRSDDRTLASFCQELEALRRATVCLFEPLTDGELRRRGIANGNPVSVRAIAYIIAGHERHHVNILRSRYLPAM